MAPIRKGDGTQLEIPGVSEVRTGDGRVFFDDAIPDLGLDHFYFGPSIEDISNDWADEDGDRDATPINDPSLSDINDVQSVDYSGGAYHEVSDGWDITEEGEYLFAVVFNPDEATDAKTPIEFSDRDNVGWELRFEFDLDQIRLLHPGVDNTSGDIPSTDPQVVVGGYDGDNFVVDVNGENIIDDSGGAPAEPDDETATIGAGDGGENPTNSLIGAAGSSAETPTNSRRDEITDVLMDEFEI